MTHRLAWHSIANVSNGSALKWILEMCSDFGLLWPLTLLGMQTEALPHINCVCVCARMKKKLARVKDKFMTAAGANIIQNEKAVITHP